MDELDETNNDPGVAGGLDQRSLPPPSTVDESLTASGRPFAVREDQGPEYERDLVARIQGGDRDAFAELVRRYQKGVFVFAYGFFPNRDDALEIVQETFMRIFEKIPAFHWDSHLSGWIYRLTHNLCVDYYRKFSRKKALENSMDDVPELQLAITETPHELLETRRFHEDVATAVECLSQRQKTVFLLKYRQGMKLQQVADAMAISLGTVKALHHRAIHRIRREMAPWLGGNHEQLS